MLPVPPLKEQHDECKDDHQNGHDLYEVISPRGRALWTGVIQCRRVLLSRIRHAPILFYQCNQFLDLLKVVGQSPARLSSGPMRSFTSTLTIIACLLLSNVPAYAAEHRVGVAAVDITPDYPVRLTGFGFRRTESEGVTQRIFAKAIAFADHTRGPAVLLTVDNLAIPAYMTDEVAKRLKEKAKLDPTRLA